MSLKIEHAPYQLVPVDSGRVARSGALLRIDGGYADLFPWFELGDEDLKTQLQTLVAGSPTPLLSRCLVCAAEDREARRQKRSLFAGLTIPESHYLLPRSLQSEAQNQFADLKQAGKNFKKIKVKLSSARGEDARALKKALEEDVFGLARLRLDFNEKLMAEEFEEFLKNLPAKCFDRLDYIEDPVLFDPKTWEYFQQQYGIRLALDRHLSPKNLVETSFETLVIKPALQSAEIYLDYAAKHQKRVVFTSYLGHPLGQAWASFEAARAFRSDPLLLDECGLVSNSYYQKSEFSEQAKQTFESGLPLGFGLGFDDLLEGLEWKQITVPPTI